jgi:hypothetical protein
MENGDAIPGGAHIGLHVAKSEGNGVCEGGGGVLGVLRGPPTVRVGAEEAWGRALQRAATPGVVMDHAPIV